MNIELKIQFNTLTLLLGINLLIFVLAFLVDQSVGFDGALFYIFGGQVTSQIRQGDLWLLVTANFFHIDILHFVFNFYSLYRIGQLVEYYYDGRKIFLTYILGGTGGVWLSYIMSLITNQNVYSLGASASIFALIGLLLGGTFRKNRYGRDLPFNTRDLLPFVVVAFLFGVMPGLNINNWAHLGGLISGVILGFLIPNSLIKISNKFEKSLSTVLFWGAVIIFSLSYIALLINAYNLLIE